MLLRVQDIAAVALIACWTAHAQEQARVEPAIRQAAELAAAGQLPRAEEILIELEQAAPEHAEIQYRLGLVLLQQQKIADAAERLERATRLAPRVPLVWLGVAQTRLQLGRREEAYEAAGRTLALAPADARVARALSMFYEQAGDFEEAADHQLRWARAVNQELPSPEPLERAAELYLRAGNADKAIELVEQIAAKDDSGAVRRLRGQAFRIKGDPARAVEEMQQAIRLEPDEPTHYIQLAQLFIDHRTLPPALMVLEEALRRIPSEPELVRLLGVAHYGTGDTDKALDAFLDLTRLQPDSEIAHASLETLLPHAGSRMPEVLTRLRSYSENQPASPIGYFLQARALQVLSPNNRTEIRKLLEESIAARPGFWPAHFELHKLLLDEGDIEGAAQALQRSVELNPEHAPAHYGLARIYAKLGDRDRAKLEREVHHALSTRQRDEAAQRRQEAPRLPYRMMQP